MGRPRMPLQTFVILVKGQIGRLQSKELSCFFYLQRAASDQPTDLQIVVELSNNGQTTTNEVAMRPEESKENDEEEIREEVMRNDDETKVEQITENHNEVDEEKSGDELGGKEAVSGVYSEQGDISNYDEMSLPSQTKQHGKSEEGDIKSEGVSIQGEHMQLAKISIDESKVPGAPVTEEEKLIEEAKAQLAEEEGKPAEEGEKPVEEDDRTVEEDNPTQEGEIPTEQEEKAGEEDENPAEEDEDEEEGCGRFVEIDDEQFEVIDDMDEDSEDDYKEVAAHSPLNENVEQMNELPGKDDYKEGAACSPLNENVEQKNEQPGKDDYKEGAACSPLNENVEQKNEQPGKDDYKEGAACSPLNENVEQRNEQPGKDDYKEIAACSPLNENFEPVDKQRPSEDDYKEVAAHDPLNESVEQVSEQLPVDWSFYQQDYSAQYQTWPSSGMAGYGSMDFGPTLVRLSGEELVLVGIICSYLQLCPSGATSGEIRDYLSRQFKERRKDVVEKLLFSLPVLFRTGESSGNTKWRFCGFEKFQSKSEQ